MEFLVSGGQLQTFDAAAQRAGGRLSAREAIRAAGLDGAWIDVTTPDVEQLGFKVVRTVIPGCQPLDNDHVHRYLGGRRLRSVPIALGYPDLPVGAYNPNPHPFP